MPTVEVANVPFVEAITHFRDKLKLTTRRFDEWEGKAHAKQFTVAGAPKIDIVNDIHASMLSALENGTTITEFRKDFDSIVEKHGWSYKGKRGWRTRTIFDTNLRTAYAAGRWEQIQRVKKARPWLVYVTVGDGRVRQQHRAWHNLALPVDDPWWDTHYPPNGWGCRCSVITATDAQLKRWGIEPGKAPPLNSTPRINTRTAEWYGEVPEGIDAGWDYNVGKAWLGPDVAFGQRLVSTPEPLLAAVSPVAPQGLKALNDAWNAWINARRSHVRPRGDAITVGFLPPTLIARLKSDGREPASSAIIVFDNDSNHVRGLHKSPDKRLPDVWIDNLPERLHDYQAIVQHGTEYIFVLKGSVVDSKGKAKKGRVVVAIDLKRKGVKYNSVRSLGVVELRDLKSKGYELIEGDL